MFFNYSIFFWKKKFNFAFAGVQETNKKPEAPKNALDILMMNQNSPPSKSKSKKKEKAVEESDKKPEDTIIRAGCGIVFVFFCVFIHNPIIYFIFLNEII